jgi:hypothetical protein
MVTLAGLVIDLRDGAGRGAAGRVLGGPVGVAIRGEPDIRGRAAWV